jgi:hypothetical protein
MTAQLEHKSTAIAVARAMVVLWPGFWPPVASFSTATVQPNKLQ